MARFYPYPFFSDNCFVVLTVGHPLWREDWFVAYSAIAYWSVHWWPITIHYRHIWECVPSSSPLTTRRDCGVYILNRLHTVLFCWSLDYSLLQKYIPQASASLATLRCRSCLATQLLLPRFHFQIGLAPQPCTWLVLRFSFRIFLYIRSVAVLDMFLCFMKENKAWLLAMRRRNLISHSTYYILLLKCKIRKVRYPMRWFFQVYLILPATLGPGVYSASNRNDNFNAISEPNV
jgi:hypothetical protein